ncbi:glycosyltransferase family 39 protein [Fulvimonas yonginensis]|uniref:Glycosyltransferase family 39 protein n=2 Tax=Fulvimonas yonginensis TaxID=1495200 RepID=A0ABU8JE25_9GAMM
MLAIALFFFLKYAAYGLFVTPLWNIPDEIGHYSYVEEVAEGHLPLLGKSTIAIDVTRSQGRSNTKPVSNWIAQHPPLYYAFSAPILVATRAAGLGFEFQVRSVRLVSALFGALAVLGAMYLVLEVTGNAALALACGIFVGCTPTFLLQASGVSHDTLVACLAFWATVFCVRWTDTTDIRYALWCATLIGLGLITKVTVLAMALPLFFSMVYLIWRKQTRSSWVTVKQAALLWTCMFLPICIWMSRNLMLLHQPLPLATEAHSKLPIGFFEYMHVQPFWQETLINYFGLFVDAGGKIHRSPTAIQASGPALSWFLISLCFCSTYALLSALRRQQGGHWAIAAFSATAAILAALTMGRSQLAAVDCFFLFASLVSMLCVHLPSALRGEPRSWLLAAGSASTLLFSLVLYEHVRADYYGELRAAQGRYFYPALPFLVIALAWPLRGQRLAKLTLYGSLLAMLLCDYFYLHHVLKFYDQL